SRVKRVLSTEPGEGQRQVVERRSVMIVVVVTVLAPFEQIAELDRLVRLVVMHRALGQPGAAQRRRRRQRDGEKGAGAGPRHLSMPWTSTSTQWFTSF